MHEGEDKIIQRPPKIYLDTNHLIYITRVRKGQKLPQGQSEEDYKHLDECIRSYCGLIFNPIATMDWIDGRATLQSASDIASVIDSAFIKYTMHERVELIYVHEILDQCRKQNPNIRVPDLPPILQNISDNSTFTSALLILSNQVPDYLERNKMKQFLYGEKNQTEIPASSAREWVEGIFQRKLSYPEDYQNRKEDFKRRVEYDIQHKDEYLCDLERYRKDWMKQFLMIDSILKAFNPGINVDDVLEKIDVKNCPSVDLFWKFHEKRIEFDKPPEDNDVDDYMFIPVIPYADISLIEKKFKGFIIQADNNYKSKVFSKANKALKALKNQKFNY